MNVSLSASSKPSSALRLRARTDQDKTQLADSLHRPMPAGPDDDDDYVDEEEEEQDFEEEPQVDTSFKHAIIVDGLPIVPKEKHEKLLNVLRKFFTQVGTIKEGGLDMPSDPEKGSSLGCGGSLCLLSAACRPWHWQQRTHVCPSLPHALRRAVRVFQLRVHRVFFGGGGCYCRAKSQRLQARQVAHFHHQPV